MPWRARYIVPRPHPLAVATYVVVMLIGVFFIANVFDSRALTSIVGPAWQYSWEWLMAVGGTCGLIGINIRHNLEDGLMLESVGSGASSVGLLVYTVSILDTFGTQTFSWLLLLILGLGCAWRAGQAWADRGMAQRLAARADANRGLTEHPERDQ